MRQVSLRDPEAVGDNQPVAARIRQVEPQLEGIKIDGRWAVIFSPFDISCALESHEAHRLPRLHAGRRGPHRASMCCLYSLNQ